eukprot:TRINITY_DN1252_c0_g2_i3.p4 TRINITY_DN1252_c0_g2~~TRINITY_DN1252_c0_g2_i3.p4  ORF type:complete len:213 (-),score=9.99 TRINITY_DN1252_c0_g2_i3:1049-1687(-)
MNSPQRWVHKDCFLTYKKQHKFMAMIDIDEFIVLNQGRSYNYTPVPNPNLPDFLKGYEDRGGLVVYWRYYGSSGHVDSPHGGVMQNYLNCEERPKQALKASHVKHIVNTKYMGQAVCVIHSCQTTKKSVDSEMQQRTLYNTRFNPTWEKININHYMFKSWEDFQTKKSRGGAHSSQKAYLINRRDGLFRVANKHMTVNCTFMKRLYEQCCQQ